MRYLGVSKLRRICVSLEKICISTPRPSETDDPSKGLILGALRRVRPTPGHLHGDLLAGVKIVFPEYIGDVLFHGALGEV